MDKFAGALGVPHFIEQRFDALEPGNAALPADSMDIVQCLFQRHNEKLLSLKSVLARRLLRAGNGRPELCAGEYLCCIPVSYTHLDVYKRQGTAPEAELLRRERQMRVKEAIFSMEPVDREIFLRYYYYLRPAPEIAEAMRLTPGAVRTRLSRGRAALKKRLSQEELLCE